MLHHPSRSIIPISKLPFHAHLGRPHAAPAIYWIHFLLQKHFSTWAATYNFRGHGSMQEGVKERNRWRERQIKRKKKERWGRKTDPSTRWRCPFVWLASWVDAGELTQNKLIEKVIYFLFFSFMYCRKPSTFSLSCPHGKKERSGE